MGAALIFLGLVLLLTQIMEWDASYIIAGWWPFILVILGGEMLFYLFFTTQENARVKYDLLSILFVAVIGTAGIGLSILQATGVVGAMQSWMTSEEKTMEIPTFNHSVSDEIKRIVVDTGQHDLTIEGGTGDDVSLFGTYRSTIVNGENKLKSPEDYLQYEMKGDSLFITLKMLPVDSNPFGSYTQMDATLVVPTKVGLEVSGNSGSITMKPRRLLSHWSVTEGSQVSVMLSQDSDINLLAQNVTDIKDNENWKLEEKENENQNFGDKVHVEEMARSGTYTVGKGTYDLVVSNTFGLSVIESR
ncbi:lipoprotein, putative [Bacillus sp. SG-1]|nr:lipoprotein, putative [Bacillus sp. SG-1]